MSQLADRLGTASLVVAVLALIIGIKLTPNWLSPGLGAVAVVMAWPGLWKRVTAATVRNRSMSVAGLVVGLIAVGFGVLKFAAVALF